jgi:hypothetical protein
MEMPSTTPTFKEAIKAIQRNEKIRTNEFEGLLNFISVLTFKMDLLKDEIDVKNIVIENFSKKFKE